MITRRYSFLRQLAWAVTLAAGFGTAWFMITLFIGTSTQQPWRGGETLVVRSDGTLLIQSYELNNLLQLNIRDLEGRKQDAPGINGRIAPVYMSGELPGTGYFSQRPGWDEKLFSFVNEQEPNVNWFFVRDDTSVGAGYFVAYDRTNSQRLGFLGLSGFRDDPVPKSEWIPAQGEINSSVPQTIYSGHSQSYSTVRWDVPPRWVYVPSGTVLRKVDLAARTVTTILETPEPIVSVGVPTLASWSVAHPTKEQPILARTMHQIQVLDQSGHLIKTFSIPSEVDPRSSVEWYAMEKGDVIAVFHNDLVYRIGGDGAVQNHFKIELQAGSSGLDQQTQASVLTLGVPSPAVLLGIGLLVDLQANPTRTVYTRVQSLLKEFWPIFTAVEMLSLILAVMAWRRSRAFGFPRNEQITWAAFVLLFGLPAYAGFRLYRRWPTRLPCPDCHVRVPRDRGACVECGKRFPDPGLKGIEIFA